MAQNTSQWGKSKAQERYASGGRAPQIATRSAELEDYIATNPEPNSLSAGKGKAFDSPSSRYERLGSGLAEDARNSAAERTKGPKGGQLGWKRGGAVKKKADGGSVAKKGGSPTSSKTATETSTKTSTVANPKGNVTVTGGAGDGDTHVIIGGKGKVK